MLALLADRVWISELKAKEPHWEECQSLLSEIFNLRIQLIKFLGSLPEQYELKWSYLTNTLIILSRPSRPLMKAGKKLGETHPAIDIAESTVRFRREEYEQCLDLLDRADKSLSPEHLTLERVFAFKRAIIASSKAKALNKVKTYARRGAEVT